MCVCEREGEIRENLVTQMKTDSEISTERIKTVDQQDRNETGRGTFSTEDVSECCRCIVYPRIMAFIYFS